MDLLNTLLQAKAMLASKWFRQWMKYLRVGTVYDLMWINLPRERWVASGWKGWSVAALLLVYHQKLSQAHEPGVWCSWEIGCLLGRGLS